MRKPAFCICENKEADQLRGSREADQRLCFRYSIRTLNNSYSCTYHYLKIVLHTELQEIASM